MIHQRKIRFYHEYICFFGQVKIKSMDVIFGRDFNEYYLIFKYISGLGRRGITVEEFREYFTGVEVVRM